MPQQMMWSPTEALYRGQASNGTVITVDEDAMHIALKQAGKGIFETDWWVETLTRVLEHWGIFSRRWMDEATRVPRMHFRHIESKPASPANAEHAEQPIATTGPLSSRIIARKKEEGQ